MKCDFCSGEPAWRYPAHSFAMHDVNWGSTGDWAACQHCKELIDADRRHGLAVYALATLAKEHGLPLAVLIEISFKSVLEAHAKFFDAKFGPPVRICGVESPDR